MEGRLENNHLSVTPLTSTVNEFLLQPSELDESLLKRILLEANQNVLTTTKNIFLEEGSPPMKKKKCKKKLNNNPQCKPLKKRRRRGCEISDAYRSLSCDIADNYDAESIPLSYEGIQNILEQHFDQAVGFSRNGGGGSAVFGGVTLDESLPPPVFNLMSSGEEVSFKRSAPRSVINRMPPGIQMQQQFQLPASGNEFCFGSPPLGQAHFAAPMMLKTSSLAQRVLYEEISITEMPVYNFESEESGMDTTLSLKFSSGEADNLHLERVQNIKSKKMQLYNAVSMALICAANFRNAEDSYRNFIENSANALRSIDPEFILKVAIYARQELNIRSVCNFLLSYAAYHEETRIFLEKYFDASIRLPLDWLEVADIYQTFEDERLKKGSLPTCLKKVLKNSFAKFDEYQLAKYNRDKTKKNKNKMQGFTLKQLIRLLHIDSPANEVMCLLGKKYPESGEQFNKSGLLGTWDSKLAGNRMKLPLPITWETQVSANGNKASVWEGIIDANKLPYMAMLRNLRNLILSGISQKHHDKILKFLENKNAVINSRQVPLQFFEAYKVVEELRVLLTKDKEDICKPSLVDWKKKHAEKVYEKIHKASSTILSRYKEALNKALEISSLHNLSPIPGKTLILCDTIFINHEEDRKKKGKIQRKALETCLMMGLMIKKACEHGLMYLVKKWSATKVTFKNHENFLEVLENECEKMEGQFSTRHTQCESDGLEEALNFYLKQQVILSEKLDHIIFLRVSDAKEYDESVSSFLNKYRETVNPDLLYTDVNLVLSSKSFSNKHSGDGRDVYLCGNSPQLIKFIAERSNDGQLTCVENIDIKYDLKSKENSFQVRKVSSDCMEENVVPAYSREPKWHSVRIFISSTFKDMHSERDMLVRYVMPELRRRAASVFVKINEVDLRWGITEADCTTKRAAELCLIEAQRCDLFIGLLGQRYGAVYTYGTPDCPELQWVKDYPQSLSITELEMHAGALRPEKIANKRAFFYFRNSNFLSEVPPKYHEFFISETPEAKQKLEELKIKIRNSGLPVVDGYNCKFAGAFKEKPILSGLDSFGKAIIEDLWNVINDIHEKEPSLDCVSDEEQHQQHLLSNFDCFIGERRTLSENFAKRIHKECGIFVITGTAGCGKTTFAVNLLNKLQNFIVIKFFIGLTPRSTDVNYMLHFISESIARKLPVSAVFPSSPNDVKNNFPDILQQAVDSGRDFILLIDGIDYLDSDGQLLDWLPFHLPKRLRLICTVSESSHALKVLLERRAFDNNLYLEKLVALPQSEKESIVRHYLSLYGKTLDESSFNNQMLHMVTKKDSGIPIYLRLACDFLRTYASFETFMSMLQSLPTSSVFLLQEVIIQMENEYGSILIQSALTLLCITKEGLDDRDLHVLLSIILIDKESNVSNSWEKTLEKFFSLNPDSLMTQVTFCSMLHSICNFAFGHSRPSSLSLTGSELEKAVKKYYLNKNYSNFEKSMHFLLAAYYYSVCDPGNNAKFTTRSGYAFRGLLSHLFNGRCTAELASLLCNLQFLEACFYVDCGEILQEYYNNILEENQRGRRDTKEIDFDVLESYKNFVCRNLHILNRHPELTLQQAYNAPTGSHVKIDVGEIKCSIIACVSEPIVSDHRLSTIGGFIQPITAVSCQESRRVAALGSKDGYLKILDYSSKRVIRNLKSHTSAITFICFGGKNRICTASNDTTLNIWSSEDYSLISVLKGHRQSVTCCCADPTGGVLLSSGWDNSIRMWSLRDGRSISTIDDFRCPVNCIDHHPFKQQVACGLWNSCIEVWDTVSLKKVFTAESHCGSVKSIAYSPDGINIISSFINSDIGIWSAEEGLKVANLKGHALPVKSLVFSFEKNMIVSGSEDCTLKVWPTKAGVCINRLSECRFCPISKLEIIFHDLLAIVFQNSEMWIMNMHTGSVVAKFVIHSDIVTCISKPSNNITNDVDKQQKWTEFCVIFGTQSGKVLCGDFAATSISSIGLMKSRVTSIIHNPAMIVCGNSDGDIGVFRYPDYKSAYVFGVHKGSVLSLHLLSYHFPQLVSSGYEKVLKTWSIDTDETVEITHYKDVTTKHSDGILCTHVGFNHSYPQFYLSGSHDNNVNLTDNSGEKILSGLKTSVTNVSFSTNYIIGCANDGSVAMWSRDGKLSSYVPGIEQSSTVLSFLVEQNVAGVFDVTLAYVDKDGSVKITKPIQKLYSYSLEGHSKSITSCSINRNGEIISSSLDGTINVWKISANTPDAFLNHKSSINGILMSDEHKLLITSDVQGTILLWKPNDSSERFNLVCVAKKSYTGGFIKAIALSKTSSFIVAVTQVRENKNDIHFLDTISILSQKSDGNSLRNQTNSTELTDPEAPDLYSLRTTHTHSLNSEVLCLDACLQSQIVVVTFKNGELLVITPLDKKEFQLSDEWIIGARIFCEDSVEHLFLSLLNGNVKTFPMSTVLDKDPDDSSWTLSSSQEKENSLYTSAFYCISKDLLMCGDTKGYLKIHKKDIITSKKIHESAITGIAVIDHYIFTSSLDSTMKGWKLENLEQVCQYYSSVPITSLIAPGFSFERFVNAHTLIIGTISGGVEVLQFVC